MTAISTLATRLSERALPNTDTARDTRALAEMHPGETATVAGFDTAADPATARRMFDLGFVPGKPVHVVRRAPLRDPVIYRVADYEIALRRAQAQIVLVGDPQ